MPQINSPTRPAPRLIHWGAVAVLGLFLASCASLKGDAGTIDTNSILLKKAEDRLAVAQDSVKEANDLIAEGQQNKRDGQLLIEQGQNKIDAGTKLKAAADVELLRAQKQTGTARATMPDPAQ